MYYFRTLRHRVVVPVALVLLAVWVSVLSPQAASAKDPPSTTKTVTNTATVALDPASSECAFLRAQGAPCSLTSTSTLTVTALARPTPAQASATASGPNSVCQYSSCNWGQGTLLAGYSCGTPFTGSWNTGMSDSLFGFLWHTNVSMRYHGTLCQNVYWDSVDCGDHGGIGISVSIDWCGSWNNGAGAPYNFTDAGDNVTTSLIYNGFPVSQGHWQRHGLDLYLNWGSSGG